MADFNVSDISLAFQRIDKVVVESKSEVALATSHIGDCYCSVGGKRIDMTAKYFDVVSNLLELVLRLGIYFAVGIGNSEQMEIFLAI